MSNRVCFFLWISNRVCLSDWPLQAICRLNLQSLPTNFLIKKWFYADYASQFWTRSCSHKTCKDRHFQDRAYLVWIFLGSMLTILYWTNTFDHFDMIWPTQIHYLYFARLLWSENLYLLYRKSKYIFDVDHFIGYLKHDVYIVQDIPDWFIQSYRKMSCLPI
jgi:hypothetical protein